MARNPDADRLIATTHAVYARRERLLETLRMPLTLAATAGGAGLALAVAPVLGLAVMGKVSMAAFAALGGGGTTFGVIDKYSNRYGLRALALSGMAATRHVARVEEEYRQSLPLKDDAKKAFIKALTDGIRERLHIRRPLQLKKSPAPQR
jgi:hypothetical protein